MDFGAATSLKACIVYATKGGKMMSEKWADYLISAVKYNTDHDHIIKVRAHRDLGENVESKYTEEARSSVVSNLKNGKTYCTITKKEKWVLGEQVKIIKINEKEFIKTYSNNKEEDNLGELPEF